MNRAVLAIAGAGFGVALLTLVLRDPEEPLAMATFTLGIALAVGAATAFLLARGRSGPRSAWTREVRSRALRRGAWIGAAAGILIALRAIDGLTPLTAGFVILAFASAELALTARSPTVR